MIYCKSSCDQQRIPGAQVQTKIWILYPDPFKLTTLESLAKIFVKIDRFAKNKIEEKIIPKYYFLDIKTDEGDVKTGFKIVFDGGTDDLKKNFLN